MGTSFSAHVMFGLTKKFTAHVCALLASRVGGLGYLHVHACVRV